MEIFSYLPIIYLHLISYILVFFRISTMLATISIFRRNMITGRLIIALSACIAIYTIFFDQKPTADEL